MEVECNVKTTATKAIVMWAIRGYSNGSSARWRVADSQILNRSVINERLKQAVSSYSLAITNKEENIFYFPPLDRLTVKSYVNIWLHFVFSKYIIIFDNYLPSQNI
jgi:hypothetical protein